jgi:hypothetical protein
MGSATLRLVTKSYPPVTVGFHGDDIPVATERPVKVFYRPRQRGSEPGVIVIKYGNGDRFVFPVTIIGSFDATSDDWVIMFQPPSLAQLRGSGTPNVPDGNNHLVWFRSGDLDAARFVVEAGVDPISPNTPYDIENQTFVLTDYDLEIAQATDTTVVIPSHSGELYDQFGSDALSDQEIALLDPGEEVPLSLLLDLRERFSQEDSAYAGEDFWSGVDDADDGIVIDGGPPAPPPVVVEEKGGMLPLVLGAGAIAAMFLLG